MSHDPTPNAPTCPHCWHTFETAQMGYYGGSERQQCCHCGTCRQRNWRDQPDPQHGPHARVTMRVYEVADRAGE